MDKRKGKSPLSNYMYSTLFFWCVFWLVYTWWMGDAVCAAGGGRLWGGMKRIWWLGYGWWREYVVILVDSKDVRGENVGNEK